MALQKELQDLVTRAETARNSGGVAPTLHLRLTGKHDDAVMEQARLYAAALSKAGFATERDPVVLDFDKADAADTVNFAFTSALHGVLIVRGVHAPLFITGGVTQLRHMIPLSWDQKQNIMIFTGDKAGVAAYFDPMAEMKTRVPTGFEVLSQQEQADKRLRELVETWRDARELTQLKHAVAAPEAAVFRKRAKVAP